MPISMPVKAPHKMEKVIAVGLVRLFNNFVDALNQPDVCLPHIYNVSSLQQTPWYHPLYEVVVHTLTSKTNK